MFSLHPRKVTISSLSREGQLLLANGGLGLTTSPFALDRHPPGADAEILEPKSRR